MISLTSDEGGTRRTWGKYSGASTRQAAAPARLYLRSMLRRRRLCVSLTFADEVCSTLRWSKQDSTPRPLWRDKLLPAEVKRPGVDQGGLEKVCPFSVRNQWFESKWDFLPFWQAEKSSGR